jgi:hypothetical protein
MSALPTIILYLYQEAISFTHSPPKSGNEWEGRIDGEGAKYVSPYQAVHFRGCVGFDFGHSNHLVAREE